MSGHSKFANIKHKKEKNDAAKGKVFTRLGKMPIDASLAEAVENENFAEVSNDYLAEAVNKL